MWTDRETMVLWIAGLVLIIGLLGVTVARLSHRRGANRLGSCLALVCLVVVGAISITSMEACGRCWFVFTTTLPLMAVGATLDLRKAGPGAAF